MSGFLFRLGFLLFLLSLPVGAKPAGSTLRRSAAFSGLLGLLLLFLENEFRRACSDPPVFPVVGCLFSGFILSAAAYLVLAIRRRLLTRSTRDARPERWAFVGKDVVDSERPDDHGRRS